MQRQNKESSVNDVEDLTFNLAYYRTWDPHRFDVLRPKISSSRPILKPYLQTFECIVVRGQRGSSELDKLQVGFETIDAGRYLEAENCLYYP